MTQSSQEIMIIEEENDLKLWKKKHNQTHKTYANIIKKCAAHGAMRSGAAWPHIGYMQGQKSFNIWRHNFFPQVPQLGKGHFRFPRKILYKIDYIFALS